MSLTARLNRFKDIAYDVTRTTVRVATPVVSATATKVRDRLQRPTQPVSTPAQAPIPASEVAPDPAPAKAPSPAGPTPATVARNIPPHPPAPAPVAAKATPMSAPGAKLPPRRRADDD